MNKSNGESDDDAVRAALRRLLADPSCDRLYGKGKQTGVFPSSTTSSRAVAKRMLDNGLIHTQDNNAKSPECAITTKGRDWLLNHENPWLLLEDLLTATERHQEKLDEFLRIWHEQHTRLEHQSEAIQRLLGSLQAASRVDDTTAQRFSIRIESHLRERSGRPGACTLPELFHELQQDDPNITPGQFHDHLRTLHSAGLITFTPWTGPLYELPEPALALLIGHEVLHYVQLRRSAAA